MGATYILSIRHRYEFLTYPFRHWLRYIYWLVKKCYTDLVIYIYRLNYNLIIKGPWISYRCFLQNIFFCLNILFDFIYLTSIYISDVNRSLILKEKNIKKEITYSTEKSQIQSLLIQLLHDSSNAYCFTPISTTMTLSNFR